MYNDTFVLNVNPQDLTATADLFSQSGGQVYQLTENMMDLVNSLYGAWEGDASEAYISKFNMLSDDIERMVSMINEHVADLEEMAMNYEDAEMEGIDNIDCLQVDVIV